MPNGRFSWRLWWRRWRTWRLLARLYLRLWRDGRVPWWGRLWPLLGGLYLLFPGDADWWLPWGWIDDALVVWLSLFLFRASCPSKVVEEHLLILLQQAREPHPSSEEQEP